MPKVLVILDPTSYRLLQRMAQAEERAVDQQARFLLKQLINRPPLDASPGPLREFHEEG